MISNPMNTKHMGPKLKESLYIKLSYILQQMEDRDINGAMVQLEGLINKIKYDSI